MRSSKPASVERRTGSLAAFLAFWLTASPAVAEPEPEMESESPAAAPAPLARTPRGSAGYRHWFGGLYFGRGVRFNNPYRLRTVLGDEPESLSLAASYLDLHIARVFGDPHGFEQGVTLHLAVATDGIRQEVLTPSYVLLRRLDARWLGYARGGLPVVLEPDASVGLEAGLGAAYLLSATLGIGSELAFSLFYGAATLDRPVTTIPMLSLSLGVFVDWEDLP